MKRRKRQSVSGNLPFVPVPPKDKKELLAFARAFHKKTGERIISDERRLPKGGDLLRVRNAWKKYANFTNPKNNFAFVKADKTTVEKLGNKVEKHAKVGKGVFVQTPRVKGVKVKIHKSGRLFVGNKKRWNEIVEIDAAQLADNPAKTLKDAIAGKKKPAAVNLRVNGFSFRRGPMNVKDFFAYMVHDLLPRVLNHPKHPMTEQDVQKVFTLELVYFSGKKKKYGYSHFVEDEE